MADIKQAALWMKKGKRVKRSIYAPNKPTGFTDEPNAHPMFAEYIWADNKGRLFSEDGLRVSPLISALLADDWEIAE